MGGEIFQKKRVGVIIVGFVYTSFKTIFLDGAKAEFPLRKVSAGKKIFDREQEKKLKIFDIENEFDWLIKVFD